jgi:flagellar protein FliS
MNPYFEQKILNADPIELVRLLYQRATASVREAREHLRGGRIAERSKAITRAYEALRELLASLRPEAAPELAGRLQGLYCYMQQRLLDANIRQEDGPLTETLGLLTTLGEAWDQIAERGAPREAPNEAKSGDWQSGSLGSKSDAMSGIALEA